MKKFLFLSFLLSAVIFSACSLNAKPEQIPSKPRYDKVQYKMNCYLENIGDGEYSLNKKLSKTYEGKPGEETAASPVDVTGFTIKSFTQKTIKNDWSTVVNIYYERNSYTVNFNTAGGNIIPSKKVQYGAKIQMPENPVKKGYSFTGWAPEVPALMPANAITFTAQWIEGTATPYKVKHYLQHANDDLYDLDYTDNKAGRTNSLTNAVAKEYEYYTVQPFSQKSISPEGDTVVDIYYNRNTFTISFDTDGGSVIDDITFKYGQTISVPTPTKDLYLFKEWEPELPATMPAENIEVKAIWMDCSVSNLPEYLSKITDKTQTYTFKISDSNPILSDLKTILNNYSDIKIAFDLSECSGLTTVGTEAFYNCYNLASITIPSSVTSIGTSAFYGCSGLTSVTIPSSVTSIGYCAFYGCSGLTSVTIPTSVTSIGDSAFSYCSGLTSVTIPTSVTSIGHYAFNGCSGLTKVIITDLESWCKINFESSNDNPLNYAKHLYINDEEITSLQIPTSVTSISYYAFYGCSGLTSVTIPSSVTSIGNYAFYNCSGLTSVTIPSSVTSIGYSAFYGCSGLTSVTIPSSVTSIGYYAFAYCTDLEQITIDSGNSKYDTRNNCNAIIETSTNTLITGCKNTVIPSSVTSIGYSAFYNCSSLTSLTIPSSVTSIGNYAFYNCSGLTSVTIPSSVTSIGNYAFAYCTVLEQITVDSGNSKYDSRNNCNAIIETSTNTLIAGCKNTVIPSSVTSIGTYAFYGCRGLTSVTIPSSVTSISYYAFYGCSGLTSVTIPSSVTSIGYYAFYACSKLNSLTFDDTTTWYKTNSVVNWITKIGGTETGVSDPARNAARFKSTSGYYDYYWYKL